MASFNELKARVRKYFKFDQQELQGILAIVLVSAFIFSFRDWGSSNFDVTTGLTNLLLTFIVAAISVFFHISCQKIYGLSSGYKIEFKTWWTGVLIMLVVGVVTNGYLPLVLAGTVHLTFLIKQRLGEFRYGISSLELGTIGMWGVLSSLIMAALFGWLNYFIPGTLFLQKGILFNIVFAICSALPIPGLDGWTSFFGSRQIFVFTLIITLIAVLLILFGGIWGLAIGSIGGLISAIVAILYGSELD